MIKLAVILCGGYGTRLGEITKDKPKGMVEILNKPFLDHLVLQLKNNGIKKIIFLVGYKYQKIKNYFKKNNHNLQIKFSIAPPNIQTAKRIYIAKKLIDQNFILLYSDNYYPLNLKLLNDNFIIKKKLVCLNLCKKQKGNFKISKSKLNYSSSRSSKYKLVEIGYSIFSKKFLQKISAKNEDLKLVIKKAIKNDEVSFYKNPHFYLSIGDKKRLNKTINFFKNNNYVLIDRDGTLNLKIKNQRYLTSPDQIKINLKLINKIKKFDKIKYICITNQAGISTGDLDFKNLKKINIKIKNLLKRYNINIVDFLCSCHHFKSKNINRKPNPGLFIKAAKKYKFLLDKTFYIGDDPRDVVASFNASTKCFYLGKEHLKLPEKKILINNRITSYLKLKNRLI